VNRSHQCLVSFIVFALVAYATARAEQHRATRLGNPATRFAPPLRTPEDLRSRFRDEKLKLDIASILQQWGWTGDLEDLYRAALSAKIDDVKIDVGTMMPFMSSRENGRPICLRNVLWAGKEPAPAYAFGFASKGERYRCVTPKACSNFYVEDLGPEPKPALATECTAPSEVLAGRPVEVCVTVRNAGNGPEPKARLTLPIPPGAAVARTTEAGVVSGTDVTWEMQDLAPGATRQVCAFFAVRQPGVLSFTPVTAGLISKPVQTACTTRVRGVPGILLELVDLEDPVELGQQVTYEIRVTNQGSAPGTNIRLLCRLPASEEYVSGSGATSVKADGDVITTEPLPELAAKSVATWRVVVRAVRAADARFKVQLSSDQFPDPIGQEESTELY
jgi:uncharacterized repeat protein (TIGR01451 family)